MGFVKRWSTPDIKSQLASCASQLNNPRNDGFVAWDCKKDLLELKYYIDLLLLRAPTFGDVEKSFLEEQEMNKTFEILKNEKTNQ